MRRITNQIFCFIIFLSGVVQAQNPQIDSLKKLISSQDEDSLKVNNLIALSSVSLNTDLQVAIRYGSDALTLAQKIDFKKGQAYAYKAIGLGNYFQANYPEAAVQFQNSLEIFEAIGFKVGIANLLSNLGATYFNAGEDTKAIEFYLRSLRISEEIDDKIRIGTVLNNIGGVYNNKIATEGKALEYFLRAIPIFNEINYPDGMATASMNVGEIYLKNKMYDSATNYFEKSLEIFQESVDATFPLTFLGKIFAQKNDYNRAYSYHYKAIKIAENLDAKLELIQSIIGLAETQKKNGEVAQSIISYKRAKLIAEEVVARKELKDIYEGLSVLYALRGDFRNAHTYDTLLANVKDSLYNSDNDVKIQQLQFNFDIEKKQGEIDLLTKDQALKAATIQRQRLINYGTGITGFLLLVLLIGFYSRHRYTQKTNKIIKDERDRSKQLLLNILPAETARELESHGHALTRFYNSVTVLFADFKGFSHISRTLEPQELVAELNDYFIAFDEIVEKFNLEKIKTIGDAYMCAGGIPTPNETHPFNAVRAGLAMQEFMTKRNAERKAKGLDPWELRIGIHTGPIVAGVVGKKKYAYDIWGDTVNIASRMESSSEGGRVNISSTLYTIVAEKYSCHYRGKIFAKNIGEIDMYFVESARS